MTYGITAIAEHFHNLFLNHKSILFCVTKFANHSIVCIVCVKNTFGSSSITTTQFRIRAQIFFIRFLTFFVFPFFVLFLVKLLPHSQQHRCCARKCLTINIIFIFNFNKQKICFLLYTNVLNIENMHMKKQKLHHPPCPLSISIHKFCI